jgi:hypothetical protein
MIAKEFDLNLKKDLKSILNPLTISQKLDCPTKNIDI